MTTETLLDERIKEMNKSKRDLKLVAVKYQEVKSNLVCMYICDPVLPWMDNHTNTLHSYITTMPLIYTGCFLQVDFYNYQPLALWHAGTQG